MLWCYEAIWHMFLMYYGMLSSVCMYVCLSVRLFLNICFTFYKHYISVTQWRIYMKMRLFVDHKSNFHFTYTSSSSHARSQGEKTLKCVLFVFGKVKIINTQKRQLVDLPKCWPCNVNYSELYHGNVFYIGSRAKLAWLILLQRWVFLRIQDGGHSHLGFWPISNLWYRWPRWSCNTSFYGFSRAGSPFLVLFFGYGVKVTVR